MVRRRGRIVANTLDRSTIERHQALHDELERRCEALAPELSKPARARDAQVIRDRWQDIEAMRPEMSSMMVAIRDAERAPTAGLTPAEIKEMRTWRQVRKDLQRRLQSWDTMATMVHRHIDPVPVPLLELDVPVRRDALFEFLASTLHQVANPIAQSDNAQDHGCFADIAMPVIKFEMLLLAAYRLMLAKGREQGIHFCDIGCGGGTKLVLARRYFGRSTGVEYDQAYVEAGQEFISKLRMENVAIERGDGLTYDGYGAFDIIYYYRPMSGDSKIVEMEQRIFSQVKPGTLIIAPYDHELRPRSGFKCTTISPPIFVAGMSQDEADAWREDAECIDTTRITRADHLVFDMGFWRPLLDASCVDLNSC